LFILHRAPFRTWTLLDRKERVTSSTPFTKYNLGNGRIFATAGAWFFNDVFFHGNKLFQSEFINVLTPENKDVMVTWKYNILNISISLRRVLPGILAHRQQAMPVVKFVYHSLLLTS
jgi:hypothetical protein